MDRLFIHFARVVFALSLTACTDHSLPRPTREPPPADRLARYASRDASTVTEPPPPEQLPLLDASTAPLPLDASTVATVREAIRFALSETDLRAARYTSAPSFYQLRQLWVRVEEPAIGRLASLRLVFTNPNGEPLYEDRTFYSTEPTMTATTMGQMATQAVLAARPFGGGVALEHSVPIGGSVFERFPSPGMWTVTALLDGRQAISAPLAVSYGP
jgi:hypothetical protein